MKLRTALMALFFHGVTEGAWASFEDRPLDLYGAFIQQNEGFRLCPYPDGAGHAVGVGHRLLPHEAVRTYTKAEVQELFRRDLLVAVDDARKLVPNFDKLPLAARQVIVDLSFQLGYARFEKFRGFRAKINYSLFAQAAGELEFTPYSDQVPHRARRNVRQLQALQK